MNKIKFISVLCGLVLFSTSCKKELDLNPTDTFSEDKAYQTMEDLQFGVNTVYGRMAAHADDIYASALLSDEAKFGPDNSGQGALEFRYQFNADGTTGGNVIAAWLDYYNTLHQINTVLPNIDKIPGDAARKAELKGQLLALRGICHYYLLESYAGRYDANALGVPVVDYVNILAQPKRNTMGEVMTKIEKDFADAKLLLSTSTTFSDTTINYLNLTAFQAKVAFYKGDYQNAVTLCSNLLSSSGLPASTKNIASGVGNAAAAKPFTDIWNDNNTNEVLFRIRLATSALMGSYWTTSGGNIYFAPSDKLLATFPASNIPAVGSDIRKSTFIGTVNGNRSVNKYKSSSRGGLILDLKWMRISEIYLMRAEAYAKLATPDITAGTADLNALRAKRINGYTNATFSTASDLIDAVTLEKYKELCFEGSRFFDLKRNHLAVSRLATDAGAAWQTLDKDSYRFILPISSDEMLFNKNMVQNPGY